MIRFTVPWILDVRILLSEKPLLGSTGSGFGDQGRREFSNPGLGCKFHVSVLRFQGDIAVIGFVALGSKQILKLC